jgi:polar amino acid transport system substrate-binding protein
MLQALGYNASDFAVVYTLQVSELYYAFNLSTPDDLMDFFGNAFEKVKLDKTVDGSSEYEKIMNSYGIIQHSDDDITPDMCITLVENTSADIAADAQGTFSKINQGLPPYKDQNIPALYVFVYDTAVIMMAHADNPLLVGKSFRGKPDVAGYLFRDEIVTKALSQGSGWVDYIYTKTGEGGLYYKTTYFQLTTGSDAKPYVVCAGRFK